mgnify:CR=1 FL=1
MPYIIADGTHIDKSIKNISITARVEFDDLASKNRRYTTQKMEELQDKITDLLMDYFEYTESEILSDNEYDKQIKQTI